MPQLCRNIELHKWKHILKKKLSLAKGSIGLAEKSVVMGVLERDLSGCTLFYDTGQYEPQLYLFLRETWEKLNRGSSYSSSSSLCWCIRYTSQDSVPHLFIDLLTYFWHWQQYVCIIWNFLKYRMHITTWKMDTCCHILPFHNYNEVS